MCLILVAWRAHPHYPLVLAANRDEFRARPAAPARWWPEPHILAGRDLTAGGAWLGLAEDGRFAALTNFRDPAPPRPDAPSRGALVPQTLAEALPAEERLRRLHASAGAFNGFNLLFSDADTLAVYESVPARGRLLPAGVYGLSNHLLDTPWPKVVSAKAALAHALTRLPDREPLLQLLRDAAQADDARLPRTGLSLEWERLLSSAFIRAPGYGTRCSTIVSIDAHAHARFSEWTWDAAGVEAGRVDYEFDTHGARRASSR
ncbi:MAG TPA: NRDE family protein [Steroidobacteraceae bacterium]|nr:NRDE family protein [Steroidobacteraceae bacterium]